MVVVVKCKQSNNRLELQLATWPLMMRLPRSELASAGMSRNADVLRRACRQNNAINRPERRSFIHYTTNIPYTNARNHLNSPKHTHHWRMPPPHTYTAWLLYHKQ